MNDTLTILNQEITICDNQLDTINATLSLANLIRGLIREGRDPDYIDRYLETTVKVGIATKSSILENIQGLHKDIGIHHLKRTNDWPEFKTLIEKGRDEECN